MIERKFVAEKSTEFQIHEYIQKNLRGVGHSHTKIQRTPMGEKIIIHASRPGLIVGRKGANIKNLTITLKKRFNLENPQIEISEVENIDLDANIIAEKIASSLERFGTGRFKGVGHKMMENIMNAGALGAEIIISGKIPSSRAKKWRFYSGYLKKCGEISLVGVRKGETYAHLKTGTVGIKVSIMPRDTKLPDDIKILNEKEIKLEEKILEEKESEDKKKADAKTSRKKTTRKRTTRSKKKPAKQDKKEERPEAKPEAKEEKSEQKEEVKNESK